MKSLFGICLLVLLSYTSFGQESEKDYTLAKVGRRIGGAYIFILGQPTNEYDFLGTISIKNTWDDDNNAQLERILNKARSQYPNFNGVMIRSFGAVKADLIKFRGLENAVSGFRVGDKVSFKNGKELFVGEISTLDRGKEKGSVKFLNEYGDEKHKEQKFRDMTPVDEDNFNRMRADEMKIINEHKFSIGEKITWVKGSTTYFGLVSGKDEKSHKCINEYWDIFHDKQTDKIDFLEVNKMSDVEYNGKLDAHLLEEKKYKFSVKETVSWMKGDKPFFGIILDLDETSHKASIESFNVFHDKVTNKESYLDLNKISKEDYDKKFKEHSIEEAKYKFEIGEKVKFKTLTSEGDGEITLLDAAAHKATIKFNNSKGEEKSVSVGYLNIFKL